MGGGTFDRASYASFSAATATKTTDEIYDRGSMHKLLDPKGVKIRESRDSADNPTATPIIVGLDVTGSMGMIADVIAREGLGTLFTGILDRKPVPDPHIMFMGIGDVDYDRAPLQVSQFEADNRIVEQLTNLWLEHGGGGNAHESYDLPWYFAAMHTVHDAMEKRGKRGYLFTVGDEEVPEGLKPHHIEKVLGYTPQSEYSVGDLLAMAQRSYDVFHIVVREGSHCRHPGSFKAVREGWQALLGQRVIVLEDHKALAETIVSAIEVAEGRDAAESARGWGKRAGAVLDATRHLPRGGAGASRPLLGHR